MKLKRAYVRIMGGLGNQMFQYAFAKRLETLGYEIKMDLTAFENPKSIRRYQLDNYNIDLQKVKKKSKRFLNLISILKVALKKLGLDLSGVIKEQSLLFNEDIFNLKDGQFVEGYFQSEKYFSSIRNVLLETFIIKHDTSKYSKLIEKKISKSKATCSIHVRRGDFINAKNKNIHGNCTLDYYFSAISYIEKRIDDVSYFIFSDDIDWVKSNLKLEKTIYIDNFKDRIPHEDIYLMSLCDHNIIANSSFSWWGAWLNKNINKIVIAPKKWFVDENLQNTSTDIFCESWIRI